METGGLHNPKLGSDSQDSDDLQQSGSTSDRTVIKLSTNDLKPSKNMASTPKGVENAKKRLRAFSIQKKSSLSPVSVPKPVSSGGATVFIGKLTGVKTQPKNEPDPAAEQKKLPKPPKPGAKQVQESYIFTQKKTLAEIEDMKRKIELVELGIPLGLICPAPNSEKAMPTKAMPPIKSFIDPAKVDELIREAKKARAEGKEFKFDYQKLLPDYDNPFQRKKNNDEDGPETPRSAEHDHRKSRDKEKRRSTNQDKYDSRRHSIQKKSDKDRYKDDKYRDKQKKRDDKYKESEKSKDRDARNRDREVKTKESDSRSKDRDLKSKIRESKSYERDLKKEHFQNVSHTDDKEADVNLQDFVVCDSWSDNEDKSKDSTPKPDEENNIATEKTPVGTKLDPMEQLRQSLDKKDKESPRPKIMKLNPVMDSFKFEIEDEEDVLDIYEENSSIDKFVPLKPKKDKLFDYSPSDLTLYEYDTKDETMDGIADDTFLESVINEIKQEDMDETSQDKGLVEYDESPSKDDEIRDSVTPDMDDRVRELHSSRSDYSDGYKSAESGCKSVESGYKSTDSLKLSEGFKSDSEVEKVGVERKLAKYTVDSLETWSFVLKICQPLLFRHDKNKCYKETRMTPKVWFTENPKLCSCVKDRRLVYKELEMCKTDLVDSLCSSKQVQEAAYPTARGWYPHVNQSLTESSTVQLSSEWEAEDSQSEQRPATPERSGEISLDKEYQRFMEAVWPEVAEPKSETPRSTPVRREASKKKADDDPEADKQKTKKIKLNSEGWSQESDVEEAEKSFNTLQDFLFEAMHYNPNPDIAIKKPKVEKQKRKRKHSTSTSVTDSSESDAKKRKKMQKKKDNKKSKSKEAKKRRVIKKNIKKLKDKQKKRKKKSIKIDDDSDVQDLEKEKKKRDKKIKKKKQLKQKKKNQKKKKAKAKSSSSSSDSSSDCESEPEKKSKKKKKNSEKQKRKKSTSESTQEELFDVNILNNIKTERITDDEKAKQLEFSPRRQKPREIINVKELQNDFVGNSIQIKKEVEIEEQRHVEEENFEVGLLEKQEEASQELQSKPVVESEHVAESELVAESEHIAESQRAAENENVAEIERVESEHVVENEYVVESKHVVESESIMHSEHVLEEKELQNKLKVQEESQSTPQLPPDENNSQCSSQESVFSQKDQHVYEKDESHLRPSSQNSNYSFHDVMASGMYSKGIEHGMEEHDMQRHAHDMQRHADHDIEMDSETYEQGNYEMYEQMAMAYQSDVASQVRSPPHVSVEQRIETVVRVRTCGEIKCDWRAGQTAAPPPAPRPSRWGLKPGEVNIVLTGGSEQYPIQHAVEPVYQIQSIANRTDNSATGYDEAYMDMYGAADKLQYGDCFSTTAEPETGRRATITKHASSLDDRISLALRTTVLGEVAKYPEEDTDDKDGPEKGILVTKAVVSREARGCKRVCFADGYRPGQDSDVEEPPVKKKKKSRRVGCAWPCPATHADHVPLWDALPPPPPPPGSPPPPARAAPPTHLLRRPAPLNVLPPPPHGPLHKFDPNAMPAFMPPEPPPGMISFQNL